MQVNDHFVSAFGAVEITRELEFGVKAQKDSELLLVDVHKQK